MGIEQTAEQVKVVVKPSIEWVEAPEDTPPSLDEAMKSLQALLGEPQFSPTAEQKRAERQYRVAQAARSQSVEPTHVDGPVKGRPQHPRGY